MRGEDKELVGCIGAIIITAVVVIGLLFGLVMWWSAGACDRYTIEHRWDVLGGCFVKTDQGWVPSDTLTVVGIQP